MASFYSGTISPELIQTEHLVKIFMPSFVLEIEQGSEDGILMIKNSTSKSTSLLTNTSGVLGIQTNF